MECEPRAHGSCRFDPAPCEPDQRMRLVAMALDYVGLLAFERLCEIADNGPVQRMPLEEGYQRHLRPPCSLDERVLCVACVCADGGHQRLRQRASGALRKGKQHLDRTRNRSPLDYGDNP